MLPDIPVSILWFGYGWPVQRGMFINVFHVPLYKGPPLANIFVLDETA